MYLFASVVIYPVDWDCVRGQERTAGPIPDFLQNVSS
uniref:Uncharacterized protein n=1 Tax=Anguilla anguilla TaxID=7936 RepID=A0A0E9RKV2_ANGAN